MSNTGFLKSMFQSNPEMKQLMEKNPELEHILNDPALMKDVFLRGFSCFICI
jgi:hypothetical protein